MSEVRLPRTIYHGSYSGIWANDLDTEPVQVAGVVDYDGPDHRGDEVFGEGARLFRDELVKRWNDHTDLHAVAAAAASFIAFSKAHGGLYAVPHDASCADSRHDHTGSRYDEDGKYLGRWVADHECPPCDCGAQALLDALLERTPYLGEGNP